MFGREIYGNCIITGCRDASHSTTSGWSGHPLRGAAHPDDWAGSAPSRQKHQTEGRNYDEERGNEVGVNSQSLGCTRSLCLACHGLHHVSEPCGSVFTSQCRPRQTSIVRTRDYWKNPKYQAMPFHKNVTEYGIHI